MSCVNDKHKSGEILGLSLAPPNSDLKVLQKHGARLVSVRQRNSFDPDGAMAMCILWKTLHAPSCLAANPGAALLLCMECFHRGKKAAADFHGGVGGTTAAGDLEAGLPVL